MSDEDSFTASEIAFWEDMPGDILRFEGDAPKQETPEEIAEAAPRVAHACIELDRQTAIELGIPMGPHEPEEGS